MNTAVSGFGALRIAGDGIEPHARGAEPKRRRRAEERRYRDVSRDGIVNSDALLRASIEYHIRLGI